MIFGKDDIEARLRAQFERGDIRESAAAAISWAAVKQNRGEPAGALDLLWEAVRLGDRETGARAWLALAESLAETGEESGARRAYARAAEMSDPALTPDVAIDLAARAEAHGNEKGAAEIYREVLAVGPDPTLAMLAALRLAAIHFAADQPRLALGVLEDVHGVEEGSDLAVEAELALAELLLHFSDQEPRSGERAEELLSSVIEFDHPDHSPRAALLLARRLGARRNFSRAFELLVAVIGCGSADIVTEADAELSAQIARQSESAPPLRVPLSWAGESSSVGTEDEAVKEAFEAVPTFPEIADAADVVPLFSRVEAPGLAGSNIVVSLNCPSSLPVLPEIGCTLDARCSPQRALMVTSGLEPAKVRPIPAGITIHVQALAMPAVAPPGGPSPLGGMLRWLRGFLLPTGPTHGLRSGMAAHVIDAGVFHSHRHAWRPAGRAAFAPLLGMLVDDAHAEEALHEMLLALDGEPSPFGPLGEGLARSADMTPRGQAFDAPPGEAYPPGPWWRHEEACAEFVVGGGPSPGVDTRDYRAIFAAFEEHRDRVAPALADGLIGRSASELAVTVSRFTGRSAQCGVSGRSWVVAPSARDDLADFAVAFDEDPPAFLSGVLEPALERDRVA